jgi:hypothetical protein
VGGYSFAGQPPPSCRIVRRTIYNYSNRITGAVRTPRPELIVPADNQTSSIDRGGIRGSMSNKFNNAAQETGPFGSHTTRLVLWYLCDHANDKGYVYAGYKKLQERCEIGGRGTIAAALKRLESLGIIKPQRRGDECNIYHISLDRLVELAGVDLREPSRPRYDHDTNILSSSESTETCAGNADALREQQSTHTVLQELEKYGDSISRSTTIAERSTLTVTRSHCIPTANDNPSVKRTYPTVFRGDPEPPTGTSVGTENLKSTANPTPPQDQQTVSPRSTASGASTLQVSPSPLSRSGICAMCDAVIPGGVGRMCASCAEPPVRRTEKRKPAPTLVAHKCAECKLVTVRTAGALCLNCDTL